MRSFLPICPIHHIPVVLVPSDATKFGAEDELNIVDNVRIRMLFCLECCTDMYDVQELREHMVDKLQVGVTLTAIFDACHSETLLDLDHYACNERKCSWMKTWRKYSPKRALTREYDSICCQDLLTSYLDEL